MFQFFNLRTHFPFTIIREGGQPVEKRQIILSIDLRCPVDSLP